MKQSLRHVEAVLSALSILDCFAVESALSVKQLIQMTGFTRNRVTRLCGSLENKRYLLRDIETGKYSLGFRIMVLGKMFENSVNFITIARPILKKLVQNTGESSSLYVLEGTNRLVLAREEGTQVIRYSIREGQRLPLHAGSAGKVILAFSPEEIKRRIVNRKKLARFTPYTITETALLEVELTKIRSNGYAFSRSERSVDAASISAPVFDHENHLAGALAISGPVSRFTNINKINYLKQVLEAADELSKRLGWKKNNNARRKANYS
jgi:DNA-binding IclR family transcriptional regulator